MKNKTKLLTVIMAMGIALTLFSCSGKDGATGPAGPAGANGVANISSNIYSVSPGSWSTVSGGYAVNISDASISNASTDGIEVFASTTSGIWLGLPATSLLANGDNMEYYYQNGQIGLIYLYSSAPTITIDVKVVVIPPSIMKKYPNTNWHDYSQINAIMGGEKSIK